MTERDTDDGSPGAPNGIGRRAFLALAGGTGMVIATTSKDVFAATTTVDGPGSGPWPLPAGAPTPSLTMIVRRPDDMVRLRLDAYNLRIDRTTSTPRLRLIDATRDAGMLVTFPPQSMLEQALPVPATVPSPGSLQARLAGPSRLSFRIPAAVATAGIPATTEGLLDWSDWLLNAPLGAQQADGDPNTTVGNPVGVPYRPRPPLPGETSIEAPWWLQISPNRRAGFVAATAPVVGTRSGNTELWHARLAVRPNDPQSPTGLGELTEEPSPDRVIRAVWTPDPAVTQNGTLLNNAITATDFNVPFLTTMGQRDRVSLIRLTSDRLIPGGRAAPVPVKALSLSALGATLDLNGAFDDVSAATGIILKQWDHRSTLGRDHYVRIVERGYLMPFGHRASLVRITERRFVGSGGQRTAVLEVRQFIVVNQELIDYGGGDGEAIPTGGRQIPFGRVRIRTRITPPISVTAIPGSGQPTSLVFYGLRQGTTDPFLLDATGVDRDGRPISLAIPLAFVAGSVAELRDPMAVVRAAWNADTNLARRSVRTSGQRVAYAPPLPARRGDTAVTTELIRFDLAVPTVDPVAALPPRRRFFPDMAAATVRLTETEALSNNDLGAVTLAYDPVYRSGGFSAATNAGGVWAAVGGAAGVPLRFGRPPASASEPGPGADRSGALVTPNFDIRALSRSLGATGGDPAQVRSGTFSPAAFFSGPGSPRLLGGISLIDIVRPVNLVPGEVAPSSALSITTRRVGDAIESSIRWTPDLQGDPLGIFEPGTLRLDARVRTPLDETSGAPSTRIDGELADFALSVPTGDNPLLRIEIRRLTFRSVDGATPDVDADVAGVSFGGELAWVEGLARYLSFGDGDGPQVQVLPDRIAASVGVTLPNITLGIFALRNIRFLAALDVPLTGEPVRVRFALSSREDPFRLTVFCIGGGGWVELGFGPDGLETLEIGFEGGAEVAVDFGPASGSISMMFGIALLIIQQNGEDSAKFMGFFRLNGSVSAGPVSASVTLGLELSYEVRTKNGKTVKILYGQGYIELDLSIPLVPTPAIRISFERSFRSGPNDPTFGEQLTADNWNDYCDAYGAA